MSGGFIPLIRVSPSQISPDVIETRPDIARSSVVFPAPFAPRTATAVPWSTVIDTGIKSHSPPIVHTHIYSFKQHEHLRDKPRFYPSVIQKQQLFQTINKKAGSKLICFPPMHVSMLGNY
jgi:hypothetical protein